MTRYLIRTFGKNIFLHSLKNKNNTRVRKMFRGVILVSVFLYITICLFILYKKYTFSPPCSHRCLNTTHLINLLSFESFSTFDSSFKRANKS